MADALLSVEVVAELSSLTTGLDKATKDISKFVSTSIPGIEELQRVLNGLGVNTSLQGLTTATNAATTALQNQRVETERSRTSTQSQRTATEAQRTETIRLRNELAALRLTTAQGRNATDAAAGSYQEANNRLRTLGAQIRAAQGGFTSMTPAVRANIAEYTRLNAQLQTFDSRMGNNQRRVGSYIGALNGFRQQIGSIASSYVSLFAIMGGISKVFNNNAELADSLADVRRTAGLAADEADNLAVSLKKIDTRTSLKGLLEIATIGGQLGIAKDQLVGFTKAIDQLAVSLGGELAGGAAGVAKSLGVLDNVFKITVKNKGDVEKSFNQIGSAILGLGQSGLATGDYLADFGERVGGVARQAGLSLPVVLAYAAVLQENGVSAEVAGTSFKKLIGLMATRRKDFLVVAQMADATLTMEKFVYVINNDTQKALGMFFKGLQRGGKETVAFQDILKSSGLSMSGMSQAVAALSANQTALNAHIKNGTKDFDDASLSAEQFAVKNDNLAASWDKLGHSITNITTSSGLTSWFKTLIDNVRKGVDVIGNLIERLKVMNDLNAVANKNVVKASFGGWFGDSKQAAKDAAQRISQARLAALRDDVTGRAISKAQILASSIKDETEFTKVLANEKKRLLTEEKKLSYNLAFVKNIANTGGPLDAQIKKTNTLRVALFQQKEVVKELQKTYDSLYYKAPAEPEDEEFTGSGGAFGTKDKKAAKIKTISDVLKELKTDLTQAENQFGATFGEIATKKIGEYQKAINELIKLGYDPAKKAIQDLKDEQQDLFQLPDIKRTAVPMEKPKLVTGLEGGTGLGLQIDTELAKAWEQIVIFNQNLNSLITGSLGDTLGGIGTEIGKIFSGEGGSIGDAILSGMSSFLNAFGDQLIQFGLASEAFAALQIAVFAGGPLAIGAAVAVIGAGIALKAMASAVGPKTKSSSGGGSEGSGYGVPRFANGGIVSGPTLAMVGEYPGAKSDPEVISPLSKLKSMIGDRNTKQPTFIISNEISMGQLITAIRREENSR